jgi:hypothetical protein
VVVTLATMSNNSTTETEDYNTNTPSIPMGQDDDDEVETVNKNESSIPPMGQEQEEQEDVITMGQEPDGLEIEDKNATANELQWGRTMKMKMTRWTTWRKTTP